METSESMRTIRMTGEMAKRLVASGKFPTMTAASAAFDAIFEEIEATVMSGEKVRTRLGSFQIVTKAAKNGINPATQERIVIPERGVLKFKPSSSVKAKAKGV